MENFTWIKVPQNEKWLEHYVVRNQTGIEVAFVVKNKSGYIVCRPNELYLEESAFRSLETIKQFVEAYLNR